MVLPVDATVVEVATMLSDLLSLGAATSGLPRGSWRIFGSWSVLLQSHWFSRLPNDVDIDVVTDIFQKPVFTGSVSLPGQRCVGIRSLECSEVRFSRPNVNPRTRRQRYEVLLQQERLGISIFGWTERSATTIKRTVDICTPPLSLAGVGLASSHFVFPAAPLEECFAQKWTRLARTRSNGRKHTRWQDLSDLYDALFLGGATVSNYQLAVELKRLANERQIDWPCLLLPAPSEWSDNWDAACFRQAVGRPPPNRCCNDLNSLLEESLVPLT